MRRKHIGILAVVLLLLVAGCSGASNDSGAPQDASLASSGDGGGAAEPEEAQATATDGDASGGSGSVSAVQADRAIIRTGTVSLTVESFGDTRERVAELARDRGGYVATSARSTNGEGNRTWTSGRVKIRVPSEEFNAVFDEIQTYGEVESATADTTDVSDQLVDIEARLETLRDERDRLRELYREANETEDVLRVSEQLSDVQTEIERLSARQRNLEDRVAFSTITVELREDRPETPTPTPRPSYADTGLVTAFTASVNGVVTAVKAVGVTFAYALPYLLAFGLPVAGVALLVARRRYSR